MLWHGHTATKLENGLDPAFAAAAMGLSSVSVVANSLRLRSMKLA